MNKDTFFAAFDSSLSHLTSLGFVYSYQGAHPEGASMCPGGLKVTGGLGKSVVHTQYVINPHEFSGPEDDVNRVCSPIDIQLQGWTSKRREEYLVATAAIFAKTGRDRRHEITRPLAATRCMEFRKLAPADLPAIKKLWLIWCEEKITSGKVMLMGFPFSRYLRCFEDAVSVTCGRYLAYGIFDAGELVSCRALSVSSATAFDLSFMSDRRNPFLSRSMQVQSIDAMAAEGITHINFGESTSKGLTHFKTRWNCTLTQSYQIERNVKVVEPAPAKMARTRNVRNAVPIKDAIRACFAKKPRWTIFELVEMGYTLVNVVTAMNDLKNPKYANGSIVDIRVVKEGGVSYLTAHEFIPSPVIEF